MRRSLLARLRSNGIGYLVSALILLLIIPLYQLLFLNPQGYGSALRQAGNGGDSLYLAWIGGHSWQFLLYRALLLLAFLLIFTLPFSLFRIIVAQEIIGQQEREAEEAANEEENGEEEEKEGEIENAEDEEDEDEDEESMPLNAWRGKGFAIIAVWAGMGGVIVYVLGTIASTLHTIIVGSGMQANAPVPGGYAGLAAFFTILSQTIGTGLLALSTLFFGAIIARAGRNLWPGIWVIFGYLGLASTALLSGSAVAVASAPGAGQAALTTPAILLFAFWVLWLGIMLVRLKPEPGT